MIFLKHTYVEQTGTILMEVWTCNILQEVVDVCIVCIVIYNQITGTMIFLKHTYVEQTGTILMEVFWNK